MSTRATLASSHLPPQWVPALARAVRARASDRENLPIAPKNKQTRDSPFESAAHRKEAKNKRQACARPWPTIVRGAVAGRPVPAPGSTRSPAARPARAPRHARTSVLFHHTHSRVGSKNCATRQRSRQLARTCPCPCPPSTRLAFCCVVVLGVPDIRTDCSQCRADHAMVGVHSG